MVISLINSNRQRNLYNVHDIVTIDSQVPLYELEYFRTEKLPGQANLIVNVKSDVGKNSGLFHVQRRIIDYDYVRENKIKYTEHFGRFGSQFSIDFSTPVVVTVNSLIARSRYVLYVNLVEPILRFLIISKGHVLLHSACIATSDQNSMLLSALPDTGKTTTVIKCIRKGLGFLSDDMTIITPRQESLCFPKPMTISAHTLHAAIESSESPDNNGASDNTAASSSPSSYSASNSFSTIISGFEGQGETSFASRNAAHSQNNDNTNKINNRRGGLRIRSIVHSKGGRQFMRKLGNRNVPIFTINTLGQTIIRPPKFRIEDVVRQHVKIVPKASVGSFFFLERGSGEEIVSIGKQEALTKAIENSDDAFLFPPYKDILRYLNINGASASDLLLQEKNMIEKLLETIDTKVIKSESRSWYKAVLDHFLIKVGKT